MYYYHVTTKNIFDHIKKDGMSSQYHRTGERKASTEGSFYKNKQAQFEQQFTNKIKAILKILALKLNKEHMKQIINKTNDITPLQIDISLDHEQNNTQLTKKEALSIDEYYKQNYNPSETKTLKFSMSEFKKNHNLKTFKNDYKAEIKAIKNDTNHPIHKLANELVSAKYNIEEAITSSHIYFFSELHFKSCFNEYTKHLGGDLSNLVVLKIHQDDIIDMKEDLSDYRCCMTEHRVPANKIQVINNI
ncbi:MAG: hypothetical protein EP298_01820 [Gammaproteobacteria bacterium]|nr:MAG: hypothetical protein EP298_01820 [Gammaproteobacteria bacterium]